jgi:hypothetical protein
MLFRNRTTSPSRRETLGAVLTMVIVALVLAPAAWAQGTYKVLHKFKGPDGANPYAGLTLDAAGNLTTVALHEKTS